MSQHDMNIANDTAANVRTDINNALVALAGHNSGATAPTITFPFMFWADTTSGYLKIRNAADTAWVSIGLLGSTAFGLGFDVGTRMTFNQTAAPSGWTKDTTVALNDSIMRIVTGTVGSGGSTAFSTFNGQASTAAYTLTATDIPSHAHANTLNDPGHTHYYVYTAGASSGAADIYSPGTAPNGNKNISTSTTGITLTNAYTGGGGAHSHGITTAIKYNDFIIASKN